MSLPVYVTYIDRPEVEEFVYAVIDSQSTISFVTSAVCDRLGIKGINTSLHLTTMTSENELVNCRKVFGLVIRGPNSSKRISISKAFSKETIPANPNHILSRETAMSWNHLRLIAEEMFENRRTNRRTRESICSKNRPRMEHYREPNL